MSDEPPRVCQGCGTSNAWRTTRLARVTYPTKDRDVRVEVVEVREPFPVCTVCEQAARRKARPLTGRVLETVRDADPDISL